MLSNDVVLTVPDDPYDADTWAGSRRVPTKNAIRNKIETLSETILAELLEDDNIVAALSASLAATVSDVVYDPDVWDGDTTHAPSKNAVRDKFEALSGTFAPAGVQVGLFNALAGTAPTVATGVTLVRTAGYSTAGKGSGQFFYDAAVDAAYVAAHPYTSFLAADGRGFRLFDYLITPFHFGALGDGSTDDAVPLQAYLDYVSAVDVGSGDVHGNFRSSVALTLGLSTTPLTMKFVGKFNLTMTGSGTYAFTFKNWGDGTWEYHKVVGPGSITVFSAKTWAVGVLLNNSNGAKFGYMYGQYFAFAHVVSYIGDLTDLGSMKSIDCGSGARNAGTMYGLQTVWSNPVNSGVSGAVGQLTTINVSVLPPSYIGSTELGAIGSRPYMIRVTDVDGSTRLHFINSVNVGAGTIDVFPWISSTAVPGTVDYVWGGALYVSGESEVMGFDQINAYRCGVALSGGSLYPPVGRRLVTQYCGAAVVFGASPNSAVLGGRIDGLYCEANMEDVIWLSRVLASAGTGYNIIGSEVALNLAKCYTVGAPRNTDNTFSGVFQTIHGRLSYRGRNLMLEKSPYLGIAVTAVTQAIDRPDMVLPISGNTVTVNISPLDLDLHRLTGIDTCRVIVVGTGTRAAPTGAITFTVPAGWTLNGASSSVVFAAAGFYGPAQFVFSFNPLTMNATVNQISSPTPASAINSFGRRGVLSTFTGASRFYAERDMTIVSIRASLGTAPALSTGIVDVNKNGITIFTTQSRRPTIAIGANTALVTNPDVTAISSGDYITVDGDQFDGTAADLTVSILAY